MKNDSNYFQPRSNVKRTQKTYLVTKLPDNSPLRNELKSSFEDVDKYLKVDNRIIIGSYKITFRKPAISISAKNRELRSHPMEHYRPNFNV